ncbi:MAG: sigma-70 family RNA polymerase sigma factor, partial [Gemmataceae bacterium]
GGDAGELFSSTVVWLFRRGPRYELFPDAWDTARWHVYSARRTLWRSSRRRAGYERRAGLDRLKVVEGGPTPAAVAESNDQAARVRWAIDQLTRRERRLVCLRHFESFSFDQLATRFPISRKAATDQLRKAEERLRTLLRDPVVATTAAACLVVQQVSATPPSPPADLAALVRDALAGVPGPAWWPLSPVKAAAAVVVTAGALLGGWSLVAPPPPAPVERKQVHEPSVADINRAEFDRRVKPVLLAELQKLLLGDGGQVVLGQPCTLGTRVGFTVELRHGRPLAFASHARVVYDTHHRTARFELDRFGTGDFRPIDRDQPVVLFRDDTFRALPPVTLPILPYSAAARALDLLPVDPRGGVEAARADATVRARLARYTGTWLRSGRLDRPVTVAVTPGGDRVTVVEPGHPPVSVTDTPLSLVWVDPDGRPQGVFASEHALSPDGGRIEFAFPKGEFWVRAE